MSSGSFRVIRYTTVPSTNALALDLALQGGDHGTVITALQQEHGRGRGAKIFSSPPGGLYMSVILRPDLPVARLPLITLAAGVACAGAIEEQTGQTIALKWPNDLYLRGRKLGGILAETGPYAPAIGAIAFVVVGIGINVSSSPPSFPPELRNIVTSLYDVSQEHYDLDALMSTIHLRLDALLRQLRTSVTDLLKRWQELDYLLGREIFWQDGLGRIRQGCGAGIREDGCYQLRSADGRLHAILAGEVSLGPLPEQGK